MWKMQLVLCTLFLLYTVKVDDFDSDSILHRQEHKNKKQKTRPFHYRACHNYVTFFYLLCKLIILLSSFVNCLELQPRYKGTSVFSEMFVVINSKHRTVQKNVSALSNVIKFKLQFNF